MKSNLISRRNFLKASAVAPAIIPASALGRGGATAPSERVNIGHIGVGGRGTVHVNTFVQLETSQTVAVSDCFTSKRDKAKKTIEKYYAGKAPSASWKGCDTYADFRELLARDDIDAVVIATTDHWHVPLAMYAIKAGKDVYVEKPLSVAMTWSWKLREAVNRFGTVFQYGTQQRSGQQFRQACELARNGYLGELQRIDAWCPGNRAPGNYAKVYAQFDGMVEPVPVPEDLDYNMWLGPAPESPYTEARCLSWGSYFIYDNALGFIAGWGAHPLDIAQWGNNSDDTAPVEYKGTGTIPMEGLFDTTAEWDVQCKYANGVKMHFMDCIAAEPIVSKYRKYHTHGTTFFGSEGWVSVDRAGIHASDDKLLRVAMGANDVKLYKSDSQQGNFIDCVKTRQPTINPVESAVNSDLISHLSDISIRLGRGVKWDPKAEKIADDADATRMLNRPLRAPWML